jgi:hypothetical protein
MMPAPDANSAMHAKDLLLPLVGTVWACATLALAVTKELNILRDKVIFGHHAHPLLSVDHRRLVMHNDWLPLACFTVLLCICFGVVAFLSPWLLDDGERNLVVIFTAWSVAVFVTMIGLVWVPTGLKDWRTMKKAVESAKDTIDVRNA